MMPFHAIEVEIRYLSAAEGGRKAGVMNGDCGQFHYEGDDQPCEGLQYFPDLSEEATVPLGKRVRAMVRLAQKSWDKVHAKRITDGMSFEIREGARVIGYGIVTNARLDRLDPRRVIRSNPG